MTTSNNKNNTAEKNEALLNAEKYLDSITYPNLHDFVAEALVEYGTAEKSIEAGKVIDFMMKRLEKKNLLADNNQHAWIEVLVAAALLHNLFYDGTLPSLFMAREKLTPVAHAYELPPQIIMGIFQSIESQLGDSTPVESLVPQGNSPNDIFALACWYVEELNGDKKMPECSAVKRG